MIRIGTGILLPPVKARHIATVMRYREGDEFVVVDGAGKAYRAVVSSMRNKEVVADIIGETAPPPQLPCHITLCAGLLKGEKMDLVVQKATELGARRIVPLIAERCQVRESGKAGRWRKIAEESVEQCGGVFLPEVSEPIALGQFMACYKGGEGSRGLVFMEDWGRPADEALAPEGRAIERVSLLIGPEGGFTPAELAMAEKAGFVRSTLGSSVLRAETAAIAALAITRFILEKGPWAG
jgi:16S rRNA (uracil1498-N3)-methyltransferase